MSCDLVLEKSLELALLIEMGADTAPFFDCLLSFFCNPFCWEWRDLMSTFRFCLEAESEEKYSETTSDSSWIL